MSRIRIGAGGMGFASCLQARQAVGDDGPPGIGASRAAPKGMALVGDRLYVSDIDRLVEIDAADGKIIARYDAPGARFLNDVAADGEGRVYVSDSSTYRVE